MSTARAKAHQQIRPPKGARILRGVVAQVSPLLVQIAGGASVAAIAVPGTVYTVGAAVLVAWQEPSVGPAFLVTQTPVPPLPAPTRTDGTFAYGTQTTDWDSDGWQTTLTKGIGIGSLSLAAKLTSAMGNGGTVGTIPVGWAPRKNFNVVASIYTPGWNGATAHLQFNREADGGSVVLDWCSLESIPSGALVTCTASYPLA